MDAPLKRKLAGAAAGLAIAAGAAGVADAVSGGAGSSPYGPYGPGPGAPPPPPFGHPPPGRAFFPGIDAAAKYLGLTDTQLFQRLRSGKSLAEVAADQNKSVQGLKDALDAEFRKHLDELVNRKPGAFPRFGPRHFRHRGPHW